MTNANDIIKEVDRHHKVDGRFSSSVQEHRDSHVLAVIRYLEGRYKPVGEWFGPKYGCIILDDPGHTFLSFQNGNLHPVPSGRWMGQPEKHWRIPLAKYRRLSIKERATLECKEQVMRYVSKQWLYDYVRFYHPKEYEERYWKWVANAKRQFRRPSLKDLFPEGTELL
jgi:hypothetical protein